MRVTQALWDAQNIPFTMPTVLMGLDLKELGTTDGLREHFHGVRQVAADMFLETGTLPLMFMVWATVPEPALLYTIASEVNDRVKNMMSQFIAQMCASMEAIAVATAMEAWESRGTKNLADVMRYRAQHGTIQGHPSTFETLSCQFETNTFSELWSVPIIRHADPLQPASTEKVAKLGEWERVDKPGMSREGRFTHLLKPAKHKAN